MRYLIIALLAACNLDVSNEIVSRETIQREDVSKEIVKEENILNFLEYSFVCSEFVKLNRVSQGYVVTDIMFTRLNGDKSLQVNIDALERYGFTWEFNHGIQEEEGWSGHGNYSNRPIEADFLITKDSISCFVDGEGPYGCSHPDLYILIPLKNEYISALPCD